MIEQSIEHAMTGQSAKNPEGTTGTPNDDNGWSNFPPYRGNKPVEKPIREELASLETVENVPNYLSDIDPIRRKEIIDTSAEMTRDIPGAMLFGGNANRILYEAYTGKTMFGVGKNDADIYVPQATFDMLLVNNLLATN